MRNSPKQYLRHLEERGISANHPAWPHLAPMRREPPTVRPSAPDVTPQSLRELAAEMRADASRWLARANDLEDAAKRLEGE